MRFMLKSGTFVMMTGCVAAQSQPPTQVPQAPDGGPVIIVPGPPAEIDPPEREDPLPRTPLPPPPPEKRD